MGLDLRIATPGLIIAIVAAILYVRLAWWFARRFGTRSLVPLWITSTVVVAIAAALRRGAASPDELLVARPAQAWLEAAALALVFALSAFGLATWSVDKRAAGHTSGPTAVDWAAGTVAAVIGLLVSAIVLIAVTLAFFA